jgi:hypothetical protein
MCGIWLAGRSYEQTYPQKLGKGGVNIFLDFSTCISHCFSRLVSLCSGKSGGSPHLIWFGWLNETDQMNPSPLVSLCYSADKAFQVSISKRFSVQNRCAGLLELAGLSEGAVVKTRLG